MKFSRRKKRKGKLEKVLLKRQEPVVSYMFFYSVYHFYDAACISFNLSCSGKVAGPDLRSFIQQFPGDSEGMAF